VRVVEVPTVVRDGLIHAVGGLTQDDFEIYDNGKKQAITVFSVEHFKAPGDTGPADAGSPNSQPRPRFLALCFDDIHLLAATLNPVKEAGKQFVRTSLAPGDRAIVVRTSRSEDASFTNDVPRLIEQIDKIVPHIMEGNDDREKCPHIEPHEAYQIANDLDPGGALLQAKMAQCVPCFHRACSDREVIGKAQAMWARVRQNTGNALAVIGGLVDGMAKLPGQRIIVLTSGGFLTGTLEADVDRLMEKARRAEVVINGLDARGQYLNASAGKAYDGMGVLASGTGGTFFHNNNNMELGFRELGMLPETSYLLGFTPRGQADGKFHDLKVRLAAKKGYSVEARRGYTASAATAETANSTVSNLDRAAMASETIADLPASFTWEQWAGPPGITMSSTWISIFCISGPTGTAGRRSWRSWRS
jgi:VWFA-related protein